MKWKHIFYTFNYFFTAFDERDIQGIILSPEFIQSLYGAVISPLAWLLTWDILDSEPATG